MSGGRAKIIRTQSSLAPLLKSASNLSIDLLQVNSHEAPVHLLIRNARVLSMVVGLTLGLVAMSSVMIRGFTLTTLSANNLTDADKSDLLDSYNTYTGALFSALSMPFQQVVKLIMPIFYLCFATSAIFSQNKSFAHKWAPVGATVAASLLLGQGMNAVNVQFDSVRIESIIGSNDLSSTNSESFSFVVTNVTNSASIAGISSLDTILRNAIRSSASDQQSTCSFDGAWTSSATAPEASIRYGFSLNSWLEYLLPTSITCERSFQFSMNDSITSESASSVVDQWKLEDTTKLFSYGLAFLSNHYSRAVTLPYKVYSTINSSDAGQMLTDMQDAIQNISQTNRVSKLGSNWSDISVSEMTIEFSSFNLSPHIQFDAVTFELPVSRETMQTWIQDIASFLYFMNSSGADIYTDFLTGNMGNEHAIVFPSPVKLNDQVRMLMLCMDQENDTTDSIEAFYTKCQFPVNSSVLIYSFAQHLAMDEARLFEATEDGTLDMIEKNQSATIFQMKNHRKIYSATVGKLSWQTSDLAQVYGAKCQANNQCKGLYFPLSNGNQHVVLGEAHIPTLANDFTVTKYGEWPVLVSSMTEILDPYWSKQPRYHMDLIYPPIYPVASDSLLWNLTETDCSKYGSAFINDVIQRHIYSKDPVQPAYTAGLFWLFQNAALFNIESQSSSNNQTAIMLDFSANLMWISPRVSMPRTSALVTIAGCLLFLIGGVAVNLWSRSEKRQHEFQRHLLLAHNVGEVLFNSVQFPPLLVRTEIQQPANKVGPSSDQNEDLSAYTITEMVLRRQTETTDSVIEIRPNDSGEIRI